jgi:multidrug efflux pump subunit AcrA (membrane-fusion protein)
MGFGVSHRHPENSLPMPLVRFRHTFFMGFAALLIAGCGHGDDASRAAENDASAIAPEHTRAVSVVVVRPGMDAGDSRRTVLEPWIDAPVVSRHKGILGQVMVQEGRRVAKGAALAKLEDDEYRLDLEREQHDDR